MCSQEGVELFTVDAPSSATTTHLLFSFQASDRTDVLTLDGDTFKQVGGLRPVIVCF